MTGPVRRVRTAHVEWIEERITDRDLAIAGTVNRLRLATSDQLERLHFADLTGRSRSVVRQRVLKRLIDWRVLIPLPRRVGGFGHGSNGSVLALDSAGQWLVARQAAQRAKPVHVRRPGVPSEQFTRHTLAVSELYCQLVEAARDGGFVLGDFKAEPAAWAHDPHGGWLKPDASLCPRGSPGRMSPKTSKTFTATLSPGEVCRRMGRRHRRNSQ